ncbi:MAG: EamA family transporter RarD [Actinobacteria bacterium]|nr:EamA family transporter RarD [Actinomycetota bacterium]
MVDKSKPRQKNIAKGLSLGLLAYFIWGSFPLVITALASFANPWEIVVWRIVFGFLTALILITITRTWKSLFAVFRDKKMLLWIAVSSVFIMINWQVYVIGVSAGRVIETSLGYFINPIFTVLIAVIYLREKLNRVQWVAIGISVIAVTVLTIDYGHLPWIALTLAGSFGIYGLAKNKLGGKVSALNSYTLESGALIPVAIVQAAIVTSMAPGLQITQNGWQGVVGLAIFGVLTAIPLILFGSAAENLPLSWVGFMAA